MTWKMIFQKLDFARRILIVCLLAVAAYILQSSVFTHLAAGGVKPNLLLILAVAFGSFSGERAGLGTGFICGLLWDIYASPLIGMQTFILALAGYLAGKCRQLLYDEGIWFPVILTAAGDLLCGLWNYVLFFVLQGRQVFLVSLLRVMLPEMLYTALVSVPLYPLLRLLYRRFMEDK